MRLCVVSFKQCWQDESGAWQSYGGFPAQMDALATLFDELTIVIVRAKPRAGGMPLPPAAQVIPLANPVGSNLRRKLSVAARLPYYLWHVGRAVRAADVVHAPVPGDIAFFGMAAATLLGRRQFAMYNSSWVPDSESTVMRWVTRRWMRACAGGRHVMLALGPVGLKTVPAPGMHWIFVSIITEAEVASIRPDFARPVPTPLHFAYVGRLSYEKGVRQLLLALAKLRGDPGLGPRLPRLTLIGDGPQRAELEALVAERLEPGMVRFAGQLGRAALLDALRSVDVCVLPSLTEGFCKARLDAMLCGVPVLTTDVGFGREIVGAAGERGWVVPPGDVAALGSAIRRIALEPVPWSELRRRCRRYAEPQTLEAWATRIGEICAAQWGAVLRNGKVRL